MTMGVPHESAAAANFSFTPLWEEDAFRGIPTEDVNKLYVKILKRITASSSLDQQTRKQVPGRCVQYLMFHGQCLIPML